MLASASVRPFGRCGGNDVVEVRVRRPFGRRRTRRGLPTPRQSSNRWQRRLRARGHIPLISLYRSQDEDDDGVTRGGGISSRWTARGRRPSVAPCNLPLGFAINYDVDESNEGIRGWKEE